MNYFYLENTFLLCISISEKYTEHPIYQIIFLSLNADNITLTHNVIFKYHVCYFTNINSFGVIIYQKTISLDIPIFKFI